MFSLHCEHTPARGALCSRCTASIRAPNPSFWSQAMCSLLAAGPRIRLSRRRLCSRCTASIRLRGARYVLVALRAYARLTRLSGRRLCAPCLQQVRAYASLGAGYVLVALRAYASLGALCSRCTASIRAPPFYRPSMTKWRMRFARIDSRFRPFDLSTNSGLSIGSPATPSQSLGILGA